MRGAPFGLGALILGHPRLSLFDACPFPVLSGTPAAPRPSLPLSWVPQPHPRWHSSPSASDLPRGLLGAPILTVSSRAAPHAPTDAPSAETESAFTLHLNCCSNMAGQPPGLWGPGGLEVCPMALSLPFWKGVCLVYSVEWSRACGHELPQGVPLKQQRVSVLRGVWQTANEQDHTELPDSGSSVTSSRRTKWGAGTRAPQAWGSQLPCFKAQL